jgi:endonuclease/exonuclease/phosphatase family metal-dependent hydrolase
VWVVSSLARRAWVAALLVACATLGHREEVLRVLVYNIHAGKDANGEANVERVAALVRALDADVVLLQEVDRGTERSERVDQLAELERRTGLRGAFGKTLDYQGGEYGIAILSRWPITADTLVGLPVEPPQQRAGGSYEPRGALHVVIDAPGGVLHVIDTHLDPSADDGYRIQEVGAVRSVAEAARADSPRVLVGGDLNAEPGTRVVGHLAQSFLRDAWLGCGDGPGLSYPAEEPVKRIDYLLIPDAFECVRAEVVTTDTSDHRPLLFVLRSR